MIRYSLICDGEHDFESWFPDSDSFDAQVRRGFVACPSCGSQKVRKSIMAPRVAAQRGQEPRTAPVAEPEREVALTSDGDRKLRDMIRELRAHVTANADDVGDSFPDLARKMHHGEVEHRSIYGRSSLEDVKALHEEGVEVHPLPTLPDERN
jgi:hypothetical protein